MDENTSPVADEVIETPVDETPESDQILEALDTDDDNTPSVVDEKQEQEQPEAEAPVEGEQEESDEDLQPESDPKEEARRRYEERQRVRQERESQVLELGQEFIKNGEDEYDQRLRAVEVERYNERVTANEDKLINEFERVKANPELQIFNPDSEEFNPKAYQKAIKDFDAGYVQRDELGNMFGIRGSLFEHLTETAELLRGAQKSGAVQQVRAVKQMRTNADIKPAASPRETQKDTVMEVLLSD